jgi:hypothetical protein
VSLSDFVVPFLFFGAGMTTTFCMAYLQVSRLKKVLRRFSA